MAILGVDDFKAKLSGGGARPNLFKVTLNFPGGVDGNSEISSFLIKGASLPASTIEAITVPFRGRQLKIAGDRSFEPWTITVINDADMVTRNAFEQWMNKINQHKSNTGEVNPTDYQADVYVEQLAKDGSTLKRYDFRGVFPTNVSAIDLNYDTENTIEEFTVELQVQYWEAINQGATTS